jgi:hypothetical protein
MKDLNEVQVRIIAALSPVWKMLLFRRFYLELNWTPEKSYENFEPE